MTNLGISHNFSSPYKPQQNGVVERRNRSLCEATRTMFTYANLPQYFWVETICTTCFTQNRSFARRRFNINPYEIINKRKPYVNFFLCFWLRMLYHEFERIISQSLKKKANE